MATEAPSTNATLSRLLDDLAAHLRQLPAGPPVVILLSRDAAGEVEGQAWPGEESGQTAKRPAVGPPSANPNGTLGAAHD